MTTEVLAEETYHTSKCDQWNSNISDKVLQELKSLDPEKGAFKYIGVWPLCALDWIIFVLRTVSCNVIENKGSGFHSSTACLWDGQTDGRSFFTFNLYVVPSLRVLLLR